MFGAHVEFVDLVVKHPPSLSIKPFGSAFGA